MAYSESRSSGRAPRVVEGGRSTMGYVLLLADMWGLSNSVADLSEGAREVCLVGRM